MRPTRIIHGNALATAVVLCLLLVPTTLASSGDDSFELDFIVHDFESVRLPELVNVTVPEGSARISADRSQERHTLQSALGTLRIITVERARATFDTGVQPAGNLTAVRPTREPAVETIDVSGSEITLVTNDEPLLLRIVGSEAGTLRIEGKANVLDGAPTRLSRSHDDKATDALDPAFARPEDVPISWLRGWGFYGDIDIGGERHTGYPEWPAATLRATGAIQVQAQGGSLTIRAADGESRTIRLGVWETTDGPSSTDQAGAGLETRRYAIYEGTATDSRWPVSGQWGVAGPSHVWSGAGTVRWIKAHATTMDGRDITSPAITGTGRFDVSFETVSTLAPQNLPAQTVQGEWSVLAAGPQNLLPLQAPVLVPAASLTFIALLSLLFSKFGQELLFRALTPFYTRLAPARLLDHPTRRAIHDEVSSEPGVHMRELHRRIGGAWGPLTFHVRMMVQMGYLRLSKQGRYRTLHPAGAPVTEVAPAIPNPIARQVHDALPADCSPMSAKTLQDTIDASRQLINYHVRCLIQRGLVEEVPESGATGRQLRRVARP